VGKRAEEGTVKKEKDKTIKEGIGETNEKGIKEITEEEGIKEGIKETFKESNKVKIAPLYHCKSKSNNLSLISSCFAPLLYPGLGYRYLPQSPCLFNRPLPRHF